MQVALYVMIGIPAVLILGTYLLSFSASRPANLGVTDGTLAPVPESPNAVSTQTQRAHAAMNPIVVPVELKDPIQAVATVVRQMPRSTIIQQDRNYLHAEFRSTIFRFVDDVEFFFDSASRTLHFRSASRVGHSDLGANRQRMEDFRVRFERQFPDAP